MDCLQLLVPIFQALAFFVDLGGYIHWDYRYHVYLEHIRHCAGCFIWSYSA
jgi:hypothetical protein